MLDKEKLDQLFWYIKEVCFEEILFRIIPLGFMPCWIGLILSSVLYGLAHRFLFNWKFCFLCSLFGVLLGFLYIFSPYPYDIVAIISLHFIVGVIAWETGLTKKWQRR